MSTPRIGKGRGRRHDEGAVDHLRASLERISALRIGTQPDLYEAAVRTIADHALARRGPRGTYGDGSLGECDDFDRASDR